MARRPGYFDAYEEWDLPTDTVVYRDPIYWEGKRLPHEGLGFGPALERMGIMNQYDDPA